MDPPVSVCDAGAAGRAEASGSIRETSASDALSCGPAGIQAAARSKASTVARETLRGFVSSISNIMPGGKSRSGPRWRSTATALMAAPAAAPACRDENTGPDATVVPMRWRDQARDAAAAVDAERGRRYAGRSKYSLSKLVGLGLNGIFAFSILPLRLAVLLGGVAIALSSAFGVYALYAKVVLHRSPQGFTALLLAIVFLSGVNLFFLGVIGEYIGRVYEQVKGRPVYIVRSVAGRPATGDGADAPPPPPPLPARQA